jgi:hypothetical protein
MQVKARAAAKGNGLQPTQSGEKMTARPREATQQAGSKRRPFEVRLDRAGTRFEVWLCPNGGRRRLAGKIEVRLVLDARHHGQDLVEELVEQTLKQAEGVGFAG